MSPSSDTIRQLFEEQVRRGTASNGSGGRVEVTPQFVRWSAQNGAGWSEIAWSDLDEVNADDVIAEQIEHFSPISQGFVWRVYLGDTPTDLGQRLERAGLRRWRASELMIAKVADMEVDVELPPGVVLMPANDEAGIDSLIKVHDEVFESDQSQLRRSLLKQLNDAPEVNELVVVSAQGRPVASSRIEFVPDRDFAGLWGGSTVREWRGRGLFRAMVAHRARSASRHGYDYLYVSASAQSRPILERLHFSSYGPIATYEWRAQSLD